ncbi:MAG: hypothetical protein H6741_15380 [Alphaproteobacteria bacterium]|nr:hypothetical protein [Alphaproteobacteria bacterium]
MWMQILAAAGLPTLGDRHPARFRHLQEANPAGFWEYVASIRRLDGLEEQALRVSERADVDARLFERAERYTPPELEWWREMYALIRDLSTRRYPAHLISYARLLERAEEEIPAVLAWIGEGDPAPALAAVRAELRTQASPDLAPEVVDADAVEVFDALYQAIHEDRALSPALLARMNALQARLRAL